jgi:hypothetical protein
MCGATEIESCCVCEWVILPRDELNLFTSDLSVGVDVGDLGHTTFGDVLGMCNFKNRPP